MIHSPLVARPLHRVKDRLAALTRDYHVVRQDEITSEIAGLAATGASRQAISSARAQP